MKENIPELLFTERGDFRAWLHNNSETSGGVWLVFGKTKALRSLKADEALEEALCYGWIDGQIQSVDETKYMKYFSKRRDKSPWSEKNKKLIQALRIKGLMTEFGEKAVEAALKNGMWDAKNTEPITDEHAEAFAELLAGISPAYENFMNMSRSVRLTYARRYHSFKTEEARQRDFEKIVGRLNDNLKPM